MSDPNELARREAQRWMAIARGDLGSALALLEHDDAALRNAAFLAQQAAEKSLKAVLVAYGREVPRIHDLAALAASLPRPLEGIDAVALRGLSFWAVAGRYELTDEELSKEDASGLVDLARQVTAAAGALLRPSTPSDEDAPDA